MTANFKLALVNTTTLRVAAGTDNAQVGCGINGAWRYARANVDAAHPGGTAGVYDVYVVGSANSFTGVGSGEIDNTDYAFGLMIVTSGATPAGTFNGRTIALTRKVGECDWDSAKITAVRQQVGSVGKGDTYLDGVLVPRKLTTIQRDALVSPFRPKGAVIYNLDTNTLEQNVGDNVTPAWIPAGGYGAGCIIDFAGTEANLPANGVGGDGRSLSTTTYAALYAKIGNTYDTMRGRTAPGAGLFRVPDYRGLVRITKGDMGSGTAPAPIVAGVYAGVARAAVNTLGSMFGEEYHTLVTAEIPSGLGGTTSIQSVSHTHSGTTATPSVTHTHTLSAFFAAQPASLYQGTGGGGGYATGTTSSESATHTHTITTGNQSADHTHTLTVGGSGSAHENVPPCAIVNTFITTS